MVRMTLGNPHSNSGVCSVFTLSAGVWLVALLQPRRNLFIHRRVSRGRVSRSLRQARRTLERRHRVWLKLRGKMMVVVLFAVTG